MPSLGGNRWKLLFSESHLNNMNQTIQTTDHRRFIFFGMRGDANPRVSLGGSSQQRKLVGKATAGVGYTPTDARHRRDPAASPLPDAALAGDL